jgi:hypothetical protein
MQNFAYILNFFDFETKITWGYLKILPFKKYFTKIKLLCI